MMEIKQILSVEQIKKDFPILNRKVNGHDLVYLDNAATSQKPLQVINAIIKYYQEYNANIHRGLHQLSINATEAYELAHKKVAEFIGASFEEIIFTKGTTESLNLLAYSLGQQLKTGDEVVLTQMEHHSNLVPWQQIAKKQGAKLKFIPVKNGELDMLEAEKLITEKTKIVSVVHVSNALGTINPITELVQLAHKKNAIIIVDGAQSVPHISIDVKVLDCDFLAFSGHKMLGPTGIGVLYGKKEMLKKMTPFLYGGDMISEVRFDDSSWNELPWKFEAGTPPIADGIGLGAAIDYLNKVGMHAIRAHEQEIIEYAIKKLKEIEGITIYGPSDLTKRSGVVSFNIKDIHPHDLSTILDRYGIAIRGGHHCAMPLMDVLGIPACSRASFYFYNTVEDVERFIEGIKNAKRIFKV